MNNSGPRPGTAIRHLPAYVAVAILLLLAVVGGAPAGGSVPDAIRAARPATAAAVAPSVAAPRSRAASAARPAVAAARIGVRTTGLRTIGAASSSAASSSAAASDDATAVRTPRTVPVPHALPAGFLPDRRGPPPASVVEVQSLRSTDGRTTDAADPGAARAPPASA